MAQAVSAIEKDRWSEAKTLLAPLKDPLAPRLYLWMELMADRKGPSFADRAQFVRGHGQWPGRRAIILGAESRMSRDMPGDAVIAWFADFPPVTPQGLDLYLEALLNAGRKGKAADILAEWWETTQMPREAQKTIYKKYGHLIPRSAHIRRFDSLLFRGAYTNARAVAGVLGGGYPALAEARIGLAEQKPGAEALIAALPAEMLGNPGLLYERLKWRRRAGLDFRAMEILHAPPPAEQITNLEEWWQERHIIIRRLMETKSYKSAYLLASHHQQKTGLPYAQAEWIAGFLALQFLNAPEQAYRHFTNLYKNVETPISKTRGAYWAGRAAIVMDNQEVGEKWYRIAAQHQTVFYGQLAGASLGQNAAMPYAAPPVLSTADKASYDRHDLIRLARIFHAAGENKQAGDFIGAFVRAETTAKAYRYAAELAGSYKYNHEALRIAKDATGKGLFLTAQSYPLVTTMIDNTPVEWALIHAIIRQESMFDRDAVSSAGALGLMQLMPATAKEVARKAGIRAHTIGKLTADPRHNIRLGSMYLARLLENYQGSYALAIAAYNAGPGRVNQWLKVYGDPRTSEIDLIDWIELIPIYETRNYVQRVLEAVYVYRLRLKDIQIPPVYPIHVAMSDISPAGLGP